MGWGRRGDTRLRVQGSVWGGGCELAMSCDLAIATPDVTFAITPAKLSIPYNISGLLSEAGGRGAAGGAHRTARHPSLLLSSCPPPPAFLNRVPYAMLKEMIFTVLAAGALSRADERGPTPPLPSSPLPSQGDVYTAKCAFDHGVINHVRDAAVITEYTNKLAQVSGGARVGGTSPRRLTPPLGYRPSPETRRCR